MHVTLFIPCLIDQFHPQTAINMIKVFKKLDLTLDFPDDQICCGQPFFKAGYWQKTIPMAKKMIKIFGDSELVVAPSGSCVNMIRHHYIELFKEDRIWLEKAQALSKKVFEFSEFLIQVMHVDKLDSTFKGKVTYHDSCQVLRGLGIASEPRQLLRKVNGLEFLEMEQSNSCCGFGGVFSFKFPHVASSMAEEKANHIVASGAEVVTGCEISCLMHIDGYLKRKGIPIKTMHLADILAQGI